MKVLILTVGGSDSPLTKCIKNHRPDHVVFLCTEDEDGNKGSREMVDGRGMVFEGRECKKCRYKEMEQRENIVNLSGLEQGMYEIHTVPPDDPNKNFEIATELIKRFLDSGHEVIVDYTGGTKSMSVGLAMAAIEFPQCTLSLVKGKRVDLIKIRDGMERVASLPSNTVFMQKQKKLYQELIKNWDYGVAVQILEEISRMGYMGDERELERLLILCRGFTEWDNFNYSSAVDKIEAYKDDTLVKGYNSTLKQICSTIKWYKNWIPDEKKNPPVFLLVYDVLLNAERKAHKGNYDDSISRMYRAIEMYGQFCLRTGNPRLTSDDIDISLIPEKYREYYEKKRGAKGKIQLGLTEDYDLLVLLGHPVKPVWERWRDKVLLFLYKRNNSFLAHGFEPLTAMDFLESKEIVWGFITECDKALRIKPGLSDTVQLPRGL